ncbi:transcriptional regulator [Castellaniella denitrificans]|uniref:transcriptional regulator n=1 Tax=Castellaniella denitrificans TaxID=56119 RepID=UPI00361AAE2E
MDTLKTYLNSLAPPEQQDFAARCGTSLGYLRKAISTGQRIGESLCINIERESAGAVTCEELRPDVDWAYLRGSGAAANNETTGSEAAA